MHVDDLEKAILGFPRPINQDEAMQILKEISNKLGDVRRIDYRKISLETLQAGKTENIGVNIEVMVSHDVTPNDPVFTLTNTTRASYGPGHPKIRTDLMTEVIFHTTPGKYDLDDLSEQNPSPGLMKEWERVKEIISQYFSAKK